MSNGKLIIDCGELHVELEADNELLYRSFSDLRNGVSFTNSSATIKSIRSDSSDVNADDSVDFVAEPQNIEPLHVVEEVLTHQVASELPDFNSLILERRKFSTSNWMLLMAWSVSHKGKIKFTKKQLRKIYHNSSKHIGLRSKDFVSNFMLLLLNDYIIMVDKNTFELSETGYQNSYSLLVEASNAEKLNEAI